MRLGPDDKFWLVTDPSTASEMADVLTETTLTHLVLMFKGGLTMEEHPTLFTDKAEAKIEAFGRLTAVRAARAIADRIAAGDRLDRAQRLEILDGEGIVLFATDLQTEEKTD